MEQKVIDSINNTCIVKMQKSLGKNQVEPTVLVYDADKKYVYEGPLTLELAKMFGKKEKIYRLAELIPNKDINGKPDGSFEIKIAEVVEDQPW